MPSPGAGWGSDAPQASSVFLPPALLQPGKKTPSLLQDASQGRHQNSKHPHGQAAARRGEDSPHPNVSPRGHQWPEERWGWISFREEEVSVASLGAVGGRRCGWGGFWRGDLGCASHRTARFEGWGVGPGDGQVPQPFTAKSTGGRRQGFGPPEPQECRRKARNPQIPPRHSM